MKKFRTRYRDIKAFTTKDSSIIRELMHPSSHTVNKQSFAEAIVPPGRRTLLHRHRVSEEIYHVTQGEGIMTLGEAAFQIGPGDTICIEPGTAHAVKNTGNTELKILCACSPAYSHDDTEILEPE